LMFAEIVHGIFIMTPELCDDPSSLSEGKFCHANVLQSYIRIYSMAVGDIELENFMQTALVVFVYVVFTFFIIIVLLTILIAIVSDSYSKSVLKSDGLFGRARVEYVAKHLARGELLSLEMEGENVMENCKIILKRLFAWIVAIVAVCVAVLVGIFLVLICTKLSELKDEYGFSFHYVLFTLLTMLYCLGAFGIIVSGINIMAGNKLWFKEIKKRYVSHKVFYLMELPLLLFYQVLGVKESIGAIGDVELGESDECSRQIHVIVERTQEIVSKSQEWIKTEIKELLTVSDQRQMSQEESIKMESEKS